MGLFDGLLGGQSGLTHATTTTNTTNPNPAVQAGHWVGVTNPAQLQAMPTVHHNTMMGQQALNNPNTWSQNALTPYGETMELKKEVEALRYILQRTVENYDELLEQHKALQDIANAERNTR